MNKKTYHAPTITPIPIAPARLAAASGNGNTEYDSENGAGSAGDDERPTGGGVAKQRWGYDASWGQTDDEEY